jgi:Fuc2NAc and GlcNAc transferase
VPGGTLLIGAVTLLGSALLTALVRRVAIARGVLDLPNVRSSHAVATPRGGGLAIVITVSAALTVLALGGMMTLRLLWVLLAGGGAVALVGFADDHRPVPAWVRLIVHLAAALWAVLWLGGPTGIALHHHIVQLGLGGEVLAVLGVIWVLNLFNFMDGIDGIAASEAVFVTGAALPLMMLCGVSGGVSAACLMIAAGSLGFLWWNWPPAKVFMGDVGSGYLGYVIAVLALAAARESPVALWVWLILGGAFFVDATLTLVRRLIRGERVYQAHRSHAYQWLARRFGHRAVTVAIWAVNLIWLLPCAIFAAARPADAALTMLIALSPLGVTALAAGSGRPENGQSARGAAVN